MPLETKLAHEGSSGILTRRVANLVGMREGISFARGSTALYALFLAIANRNGPGEVVVPSICCESVAMAAIYAGHKLRFAELSLESICITPETVAPLMSGNTRAVVVAHIFGSDANAASFDQLRRKYPQVVFIEDIAHALGGRDSHSRMLGGGLDFSLLSFADSKIIGGDGGMLLLGTKLFDAAEITAMVPTTAPHLPQPLLAQSLRNIVHGLADLWRRQPAVKVDRAFCAVLDNYRDLIICAGGIADEQVVVNGFDNLEENRKARYAKYDFYRNQISPVHARVIQLHEGSTCWRCPVIFDDPARTLAVTQALRSAGIHASNHYFPLNILFGSEHKPESEKISAGILNLWTDENATREMMYQTVNIINNF